MSNNVYEKCRRRLVKEGVLKALSLSLIIACGAMALMTFFSWYFGFKAGLYISIGLFAVCLGGFTPLFYFLRFRPTTKEIARRVDALGLEERMITMTELEGEDSFIARAQRRDTENALGGVNHMFLKIAISVGVIVGVAVSGTLGLGTFTVDALHNAGIIPSGRELAAGLIPDEIYHISYLADGEGFVVYYTEEGEEEPIPESFEVKSGGDAPAVLAIPSSDDMYVFVGWSDGVTTPYRHDTAVSGNSTVWAIFSLLGDVDRNDLQLGDNSGNGPSSGQDENNGGEESQPQDPGGDPNDGSDSAGGYHNAASQQVYDGETYYGDSFSDAYREGLDRLESDDTLTDEQKSWVADYYESIERDKEEDGDDTLTDEQKS